MNHAIKLRCMSILSLAFAAGCAGSPPQNFYTLGSEPAPAGRAGSAAYSIGVGPVIVPAIVDRPQFVLSDGPNRVTLSEQSRWAEPLKEGIPRVIAGSLAGQLPEVEVFPYPHGAVSDPDYRVFVDVQRFDSTQGEAVTVDILWSVSAREDGMRATGRSFKREPAHGSDVEALAAAHGRALAAIGQDIAATLREKIESRTVSGAAPGITPTQKELKR